MSERYWSQLVRSLKPYVPGEQPRGEQLIKLNTNENPYGPGPRVAEALKAFDPAELRLYPDPTVLELREKLAERTGMGAEHVFTGNGSDEVLAFAFAAFGNPQAIDPRPVVWPEPTYGFYPVWADFWQLPYRAVSVEADLTVDVERLLEQDAQLYVIANPNAPTGQLMSETDIRRLLETGSLVIVDEAYADFAGLTVLPLVKAYENLLVVRTFSKSRSLAGLRVGAAYGQPQLIQALEAVRDSSNSYTVDRLAQRLALASLEDEEAFRQRLGDIIRTRDGFSQDVLDLGLTLVPSKANFMLLGVPGWDGARLLGWLRKRGVLVRYFAREPLRDMVRVTIGRPEEMRRLLELLKEAKDEAGRS